MIKKYFGNPEKNNREIQLEGTENNKPARLKSGFYVFIPYTWILCAFGFALGVAIGDLVSGEKHSAEKNATFEKNQTPLHEEETAYCNFSNRCFRGKINGKYCIEMYLDASEGLISGYYTYAGVGKKLKIAGEIDPDGYWMLYEYDHKGNQTGIFEIYTRDSNILEGDWSKPDNSAVMPFILVAEQPLQTVEKQMRDSVYADLSDLNGEFVRVFTETQASRKAILTLHYLGLNKFTYNLEITEENETIDYAGGIMTVDASGSGTAENSDIPFVFRLKTEMANIAVRNEEDENLFSGNYFRIKTNQQLQFYTSNSQPPSLN
jgi:hypothetical protein